MNNPTLIRSLHPLTALIYAVSLFVPAMIWNNPLWLIALLMTVGLSLLAAAGWRSWRNSLILSLSLAAVYVAVNALLSRAGSTTLWISPALPLLGTPRVSLEALVFGVSAGLKIALAVSIFKLYQELLNQDDALSLFSRLAPKSALTIILAVLLVPRMRRDLSRISNVMRLRGAPLDSRGIAARIRAARPLLQVLLLSSLEGSWDIATALNCRAFGSGKRSVYESRAWLPRDWLVTTGTGLALLVFAAGLFSGRGTYNFYPRLDPAVAEGDLPFLSVSLCLLSLPWLLNWSWGKWPFLKSRI